MKYQYAGNTTKPGHPLWTEYVQVDDDGTPTGGSTMEVHTPKRITNFDNCEHNFEYQNNGNDAVCSHCGYGQRIILGIHKIVDGKVITRQI